MTFDHGMSEQGKDGTGLPGHRSGESPAGISPAPEGGVGLPRHRRAPAPGEPESSNRLIGGRYRLATAIGQGSMGRVWLARDELLDRDVALKEIIFSREFGEAEKDERQQRLLREARSAARLSHPAVATVFDVVEDLGRPWIVMEFVRGRPLDRILKEQGPLQPHIVAQMGQDLLSALAAAHAVGVLHRDVKPSNVLLTSGGGAVLTDFGVATIEGAPSLTWSGMVVGTPAYTAPERIRGERGTAAADLWSLGLTLYAASEGEGPYEKFGTIPSTIAAIATRDPEPPGNAGPNTPVIMALLSRDPAARPTAEEAMRLLAEATSAPPAVVTTGPPAEALSGPSHQAETSSAPSAAEAGPPAGNSVDPAPPNHKRRGRRPVLMMVVAAFVVVLGVSVWAVHQPAHRVQALQSGPEVQSASPIGTENPATARHHKSPTTTGTAQAQPTTAQTQPTGPQASPSRPPGSQVPFAQHPVPLEQQSSSAAGPAKPTATIVSPVNGSSPPTNSFGLNGTVNNIPSNTAVWLVDKAGEQGYYYPVEEPTRSGDNWSIPPGVVCPPGGQQDMEVWSASPSASDMLQNYVQNDKPTNNTGFPAMPAGTTLLATSAVTVPDADSCPGG